MEVELVNVSGKYEIWVDNAFVNDIKKLTGETAPQYQQRAEDELNRYVTSLKNLSKGKNHNTMRYTPKSVKKVTI